jgi:hypothetical protein
MTRRAISPRLAIRIFSNIDWRELQSWREQNYASGAAALLHPE